MKTKTCMYTVSLVCLLLCLLPSCSTVTEDNTEDTLSSSSSQTYYQETQIDLSEYGKVSDILWQGDQYILLSQSSQGSQFLELDTAFKKTDSHPSPHGETVAFTEENGIPFYCAKVGNDSYSIFKEDQLLFTLSDLQYMTHCQLLVAGDVVCTFFHNQNERFFFINDQFLAIPEPTVEGMHYEGVGFVIYQEEPHIVLHQYHFPYGSEAPSDYSIILSPIKDGSITVNSNGERFAAYTELGKNVGYAAGLLFSSGDILCLYTNGTVDDVTNLSLHGISGSNIQRIVVGQDGKILLLQDSSLTVLTPTTGERIFQEVVVGYVTNEGSYFSSLDTLINCFNRENETIKVWTKYFHSTESMNLALLSGEIDIIMSDSTGILNNYAARELLLPLESILPSLFEDGVLLDNVKKAYQREDSWYFLPFSIYARGLSLPESLMDGRTGFSDMKDFADFLNTLDPIVLKATYQEDMYLSLIGCGMENWIDWDTGTVSFTDESFIQALEICADCSSSENWHLYASQHEGIGLFFSDNLTYTLIAPDTLREIEKRVAFPIPSGKYSGMAISGNCHLAQVVNAPNPDGATEFLSFVFCDTTWNSAITVGSPTTLSWQFPGSPIKQKEAEAYFELDKAEYKNLREIIWDFHTGADHVIYSGPIDDIIREEASRYFAGDITAEQAAAYIQNRVSIYLAEQR